jgi:hypothetical protein
MMLHVAGLLAFMFVLSSLAMAADESKNAPKDVPDFDVHGISMTECQCTAYACPCRSTVFVMGGRRSGWRESVGEWQDSARHWSPRQNFGPRDHKNANT